MKTSKHYVFIGILTFFLFLSIFSCSDNKNNLSGTWEITEKNSYEVDPDNKYIVTINFSGKDFNIVSYPMFYEDERAAHYTNSHSFHPDMNNSSMKHYIDWEKDKINFSRIGRGEITIFRNELKGKYSISDNKIELLFSDGKINVCSFSRTENTITIDGKQFTRSKKAENNKASKGNDNNSNTEEESIKTTGTDSKQKTEEKNHSEIDIRGAVITVASWWQDYNTANYKPKNESERKELEWRINVEKEYGFKLVIKKVSNYDNYSNFMTTNIMHGNKEYNCYHASPEIAELFYEYGLLYPVSNSSVVDLKNREAILFVKPSYNSFVEDLTTFNYYGTNKSFGWGYGSSSNIDSFYIIPAIISPKEADIILKASEIWNTPVDGN